MSADEDNSVLVVLDTNVLLSLYVFADSRFAPLRDVIETGQWRAATNQSCLAEFVRVLSYPMFSLTAAQQENALANYVKFAHHITSAPISLNPIPLPRCTDADDQKFLELSRDCGAKWLVTSDHALLKLTRRLSRAGMFGVVKPEFALAHLMAASNGLTSA
jgi:uncharacterized protein